MLDCGTKGIFLSKCLIGHLVLYPHDKCERFLSRQCQAEIVTKTAWDFVYTYLVDEKYRIYVSIYQVDSVLQRKCCQNFQGFWRWL